MMRCQVQAMRNRNSWSFPKLVAAFLHLFIAFILLYCSAFTFFISKSLSFFGFTLQSPYLLDWGWGPTRYSQHRNRALLDLEVEDEGGRGPATRRPIRRRRRGKGKGKGKSNSQSICCDQTISSSLSQSIIPSHLPLVNFHGRTVLDSESNDRTDESKLMYDGMMGSQVMINSWTFPKLVAAFLDLLIAYCLLCCSAFAFFLSKSLSFFGFTLPCPYNGLFSGSCLNHLLVDWGPTHHSQLVRDRERCLLELEDEGEGESESESECEGEVWFGKGAANRRRIRRRCKGRASTKSISSHHIMSSLSHSILPSSPSHRPLINFHGRTVLDSESNDPTDESKLMYENATSFHDLNTAPGGGHVANGVDENSLRILELALEDELVSHDALWSELEKERLAAATAADEAMAMMSRLQEEKASIQIQAQQLQRILEEKSAYDAEEMDILKEIIVRREREKHYLEKEVEGYRKMFKASNENQSNDLQEQNDNSFLDLSADPMLILQQLSESIDKRRNSVDVHKRTCTVSESKELSIPCWDHKTKTCPSIIPDNVQSNDEVYQNIQEKGVLSLNEVKYPHLCETSSSQWHNKNTMFDALKSDYGEPLIHDVHIIDPSCSSASNCQKDDKFTDNCLKVESETNRSSSDTVEQFATDRSFVSEISEIRHNSLSAVDNERLKIGNQIGWLTERLRAVQEEKKRLKGSMENQELQLRDVASQHQEQIARHTSLPPLSSKVMSKKRRSRSASLGVDRSESS